MDCVYIVTVLRHLKPRTIGTRIGSAVGLRYTFRLAMANNCRIRILDTLILSQLIRATETPLVIGSIVTGKDPG